MTDVLAIQTGIATEVVEELRIALTGDFPALDQTTPEIHALYLQARHILETGEVARLGYARDLLEQAVEDDPNFSPPAIGSQSPISISADLWRPTVPRICASG